MKRLVAGRRLLARLEAALTAAAFAEEGDVETARRLANEGEAATANGIAAAAPAQEEPGGAGRHAALPARVRRLHPAKRSTA